MAFQERWLDVTPGMKLYYRDFGPRQRSEAAPVICLPGYWRNCRDYEELAAHLSLRRRVITPDLRGRGKSGRSDDVADYHFDRLVEDVMLLTDTLQLKPAVFVGAALGGQIALVLGAKHPAYVAGIVLNDLGAEGNPSATTRMKAFSTGEEYAFDEAKARIRAQNEPHFKRFGEDDWVRLTHRAYREAPSGKFVRDFDQRTNEELARIKAERPNFWPEYLGLRGIRITILRGEHSDYLTPEVAARMIAEKPEATLSIIPETGHPPALYEPESLAAIDAFLARVDAASVK